MMEESTAYPGAANGDDACARSETILLDSSPDAALYPLPHGF